jgi:hypothetical protein
MAILAKSDICQPEYFANSAICQPDPPGPASRTSPDAGQTRTKVAMPGRLYIARLQKQGGAVQQFRTPPGYLTDDETTIDW